MSNKSKEYNVIRKNRANVSAVLRGAVACYLLYLGVQIAMSAGKDPSFPVWAAWVLGGFFCLAGAAFGVYTWRRYRADLKAAELTEEEQQEAQRQAEEEDQ